MLAKTYTQQVAIERYAISEKLDGVRAYWNGMQFMTRSGYRIDVPLWFKAGLPNVALDGELWLGRGRFDEVSGLIRSDRITNSLWQQVSYQVFDMPNHPGDFENRIIELTNLLNTPNHPHLQAVKHQILKNQTQLDQLLWSVVNKGGEGLMLNQLQSYYEPSRTSSILKLKPKWDDEAQVIGFTKGKGKYQGLMGAVIVRMKDGREFKIGTGFSDEDRANPPALNSWMTFEYSGLTSNGIPRFARYIRPYFQM